MRSSPFMEILIGGLNFNKRFESYFNVGFEAGLFAWRRVRIAGRVLMFPADPDDQFNDDTDFRDEQLPAGFSAKPAEPPVFVFGGSVGIVAARTANFAFSPGMVVLANDQADEYGTFFGLLALPFDWVTDTGLRIGFELTLGPSVGGRVFASCTNPATVPPQAGQCPAAGEVRVFDREAGAGFYSHFHIGWGFDHPEPISYRESR